MSTNTGGQQFYSALQSKATSAVQDTFKSILYPIQYPSQGDFPWNYQNQNQVFNQGTFNYISARVSPGDVPGTAKLSEAGGFPNAYTQVISTIAYTLSRSNQAKLNAAQSDAMTQSNTIVSDFQTTFGTITDADLQAAQEKYGKWVVRNRYDYIISAVLGAQWSGREAAKQLPLTYTEMANARDLRELLPQMPASGDQVVSDVSVYLNIMQPVLALQESMKQGSWIIAQMQKNTKSPSKDNGGMQTVDPNTGAILGYQVGYGISASLAAIKNDLDNKGRTISLAMTTSQASGSSLNVNIEGQAGFSVGSWLQFTTSAGAEYDMSKAQGTSTDCSVTMTWAGYSMVPVAPSAWQQGTNVGWYYADPIAQAVKNGNQDVDGFKFTSDRSYTMKSLKDGGTFGILTNLLVSSYPTISITYRNASFSRFQQSWKENVSGNLTLFGFIKLGSFSQGAYSSSFSQGSDDSTFTVTFSASPQVLSVPQMAQTVFVIGGAVENPGVG